MPPHLHSNVLCRCVRCDACLNIYWFESYVIVSETGYTLWMGDLPVLLSHHCGDIWWEKNMLVELKFKNEFQTANIVKISLQA